MKNILLILIILIILYKLYIGCSISEQFYDCNDKCKQTHKNCIKQDIRASELKECTDAFKLCKGNCK